MSERPMSEHGIHHVTAIAGDARRNRDFYTGTLGLRLVKKTVNFDDPGTYHLYFGDETGRPGTILTFFPWAHVAPGRAGIGQALVGVAGAEGESAWSGGEVPAEHAIRGFAGVTLMLDDAERTGAILS